MKGFKGSIYIILSSSAFGLMPILAKLAYRQGTTPYTVLFLRFLLAGLMLLYYIFTKGISLKLNLKQTKIILLLGILGYSSTALCMFNSYKFIPVGLATIILYSYPAIVTVLSFFFYKEKLYKKKLLSLLTSSIGIFLLVGFNISSIDYKGILLALIASVLYSIYVLGVSSAEIKKLNSHVVTFYISILSGISILIVGLVTDNVNVKLDFYSLTAILLLAFISTVIALMTFVEGVKLIGPSKASILSTLEPIVSIILGFFILNEGVTIQVIVGGIMVILSIIVLTIDFKKIKIFNKA